MNFEEQFKDAEEEYGIAQEVTKEALAALNREGQYDASGTWILEMREHTVARLNAARERESKAKCELERLEKMLGR